MRSGRLNSFHFRQHSIVSAERGQLTTGRIDGGVKHIFFIYRRYQTVPIALLKFLKNAHIILIHGQVFKFFWHVFSVRLKCRVQRKYIRLVRKIYGQTAKDFERHFGTDLSKRDESLNICFINRTFFPRS